MERADFEQWKAKEVARLLALVETERRYYQEMVSALPIPLVVISSDKSVVWANRAFRRTFELRVEDLRRKDIEQVLAVSGLGEWLREAHSRAGAVAPLTGGLGLDTFRISAIPLRDWDDESEAETLLLVEQVSAGAKAAAAPAAPQIPPNLPAVLWQADVQGLRFQSVSGAAEELLGYPVSHWLARPEFFEERIHPEDRKATLALYLSAVERGGEASAEYRAVTKSGDVIWCRETIRASPPQTPGRTVTGVITNITQRKQVEQQMLSAARLDASQALAGRMAHDLNNPLMIVTGYGEELLRSLPEGNPLRADMSELLTAAQRIAAVTARLTELTVKQAAPPAQVDLGALIARLRTRIARAVGERITIEILPAREAVWASADPGQLEEVLLALAAGSLPGAEVRTRVTISVDSTVISERVPGGTLGAGRFARITLRDDGTGLDPEKQSSVFDAGSGITRAYRLVRLWGGDIGFTSEPQRGSTFFVYLPLAAEGVPEKTSVTQPAAKPGRETVLVVDDEAGIRGLMRKILERENYTVIEASSAEEALQAAQAREREIDLLLTDVMLPGMLGTELARRLYDAKPGLKVLYISGHTPDETVRSGKNPPGSRFLAKPFTLGALLARVRETLDA